MIRTLDLQKTDDGCNAIYTDYTHPMQIVEQALNDYKSCHDGLLPRMIVLSRLHEEAMGYAPVIVYEEHEVQIKYFDERYPHGAQCYTRMHFMVTLFRAVQKWEWIQADTHEEAQDRGLEKLSLLRNSDFQGVMGKQGVEVDGETKYLR